MGIRIAAIYLAVQNIFAFALFGIDKMKAVKNAWRISERTLMAVAAAGGAAGALLAMELFRHKTKHKKFTIGIRLILVIQILIIVYAYIKFVN
ncbi:MAG: DUF1294 domain-containing protein [Clostridiales bacterium]|nr:DUF1294 domain-containing protein [Clostridiales bacterium]